ncbi:hypothetical protein [Helicobacter typhlonius]|uniref:hypothetical protein n=1 Tax=Helicobacter typhlonius TaxID=76936 RepID=UPI002FE39469
MLKSFQRLSRGVKIALMLWVALFVIICISFGVLKVMSKDRIYTATMIVHSNVVLECKERCLADKECENACIKDSKQSAYTYSVKLKFDNPIFRAHTQFATISLLDMQWSKDIGLVGDVRQSWNYIDIDTNKELQIGKNIGTLSYVTHFESYLLYHSLSILIYVLICGFVYVYARDSMKLNTTYPKKTLLHTLTLNKKDKIFLGISGLLIALLFAFQFWLGFPGFHIIGDTYSSILLTKDNGHPVFISYVLEFLYALFGKHLYYLYLFNLVPFYAGLFFLVWGFYLRFKSVFAISLLFPLLVGNIYFQNFIQYHSFALPMLLFCGYSMVFFIILVPLQKRYISIGLWCSVGIVFFCAILWRHNAIFSVFPVSFVLVYMWLCDRGLDKKVFTWHYVKGVVSAALVCLCIVIFVPKILKTSTAYPANHLFLLQLAAMCVPANDSSCFKEEWYYPHKNWEDIKALYKKYPLNADPFNVSWGYDDERPIPYGKIDGLHQQWIKAICKYPHYFVAHELRFIQAMWIQQPQWIFNATALEQKAQHPYHLQVVSGFSQNERSIVFSPIQREIYDFLYTHRIVFNHLWGVLLNASVMLLAGFLLVKYIRCKEIDKIAQTSVKLLILSFSIGFAGFFSAFFITAFTPVAESRYMSPILPLGIMAVVSFVAFMLSNSKKYE